MDSTPICDNGPFLLSLRVLAFDVKKMCYRCIYLRDLTWLKKTWKYTASSKQAAATEEKAYPAPTTSMKMPISIMASGPKPFSSM